MNKLVFLVGLPGCGKSTYAEENLAQDYEILSSDKIRLELLGSEENQSNNSLVFETLFERARNFLKKGKNVVLDATNVDLKERQNSLNRFNDLQIERIAIVIDTPFEICVERDKKRGRTVGEAVIRKFANRFVMPTKEEGFNEIIIVK